MTTVMEHAPSITPARFLELNPNPVMVLNYDRRVTYLNGTARARFPHLASHADEHPLLSGLDNIIQQHEGDRDELIVFVREVSHAGIVYDQQILSIPAERNIYLYMTDITERKFAENELRRAHSLMESRVTERTAALDAANKSLRSEIVHRSKMQEELERAKEAADAANKAKSTFLATMSHELRTPLNGVIGMIEVLTGTPLSTEQRRFADIAKSSAHTLLYLINDILDFSKIEAGKLELECVDFDLQSILDDLSASFSVGAANKKLRFSMSVDSGVPRWICGDPVRLKQILMNLISNALKFTGEGAVTVHVALLDEQAVQQNLGFTVQDCGIGIPSDRLPRLFQSFSQADSSTTRKFGGTGLGLSICKRLVEMMGGQIAVESTEGKGSIFRFNIVCKKAADSDPSRTAISGCSPTPEQPGHQGRLRVLLAEDNAINQEVASAMFSQINVECRIVEDGAEAVNAAQDEAFDIILMDCQMPKMDGYEATKAIRTAESEGRIKYLNGPARIPIIALTANATDEDRVACREAGMDGFITKPLDMKSLKDLMDSHRKPIRA